MLRSALLVLLPLGLLLSGCEEKAEQEVLENIRAIKYITVTSLASGQERRFPGTVEAVDTSSLSFEVAGNTREVAAKVGDRVTQGQVLATLDAQPFELDVEAAEAEVGRAKANLAEKMTEFDRQSTLYAKGWVSKAAYDQAVAARDSASNEVSFAVSKLNLAKRDLGKTELLAPFDGVIASKFVDPFQEVARGEKAFEIYAEGAMEVQMAIPETVIADIFLGQEAQVRFPGERLSTAASAAGSAAISARVTEVGTVASEANAFPVKVTLLDAPAIVLPGMTADVTMTFAEQGGEASYLLPVSAFVPGEEQRKAYVFVFDEKSSRVQRREVNTQGVEANNVAVSGGIEPGDIVAIAGVSFLRDGQQVTLLQP